MKLEYLNKKEYQEWNKFVEISPEGSIFSKSWYLNALDVEYQILTIKEKNIIKAGIVLAKNEINTYSNPIFDKYLGILFEPNSNNLQKYISHKYKSMNLISKELKKYISFDYYFHPNFNNWIPLSWSNFTQQTRYTYRIDNSLSFEEIEKNFHSKLKNDIKNAIKNSIKIKYNIPFEEFWDIINKTYLRQGSKAPFSKEKLENFINRLIEKNAFFSMGAYDKDNKAIAVLGIIYEKKSSYLLLNGIDIKRQIRGSNALIIKESIKYFHNKCDFYDFEGSMLPGVEEFYRKFGGELTSYYKIWNDNFFNFFKIKAKKLYKKMRYGR